MDHLDLRSYQAIHKDGSLVKAHDIRPGSLAVFTYDPDKNVYVLIKGRRRWLKRDGPRPHEP
jgi:hypothetical protein